VKGLFFPSCLFSLIDVSSCFAACKIFLLFFSFFKGKLPLFGKYSCLAIHVSLSFFGSWLYCQYCPTDNSILTFGRYSQMQPRTALGIRIKEESCNRCTPFFSRVTAQCVLHRVLNPRVQLWPQ